MSEAKTEKRRRGDRKDAYLVRNLDAMHIIMPFNIPKRTANEAVIVESVDLTAIKKYLEVKNADNPEFKYTFFHVILAAIAKTIVLRPYMNRFFSGDRLYQRKDISMSFVVKKKFADDAYEALAIIKCDQEGVSPIEDIYSKVKKFVYSVRKEGEQGSTGDIMDVLVKFPRWVLKLVFGILRKLEYYGMYPASLMKADPYYSTCFVSNLGSIKMHAQYHHLADWGTNSLFAIIGEKKPTPFYGEDGSCEVKETLDLGITVDERIADGVYFAKSIRILKHLLANPELLELPIETPVEL